MIDLGYSDRNAFSGLKTLTLVLILYFLRVFISIFTGFLIKIIGCKHKYLKKFHLLIAEGLFFNQIIRISMEAYYEFFLIGHMNYLTAKFTLIGEKLGIIESSFILIMVLIVLPILAIFIMFKTKR